MAALAAAATPAAASEDDFELWLNPSVATDLDDDTGVELETAQRFRDDGRGRTDTFFFRLWLNQKVSKALTASAAAERRINHGGADETRLIQQLSGKSGIVRARVRLEQRFVDRADRMGLRLRTRVGVTVPLADEGRWAGFANTEPFFTLSSTSRGGDTGLTGLRSSIGMEREVSERLTLSLGYLNQRSIDRNGPDEVAHAPILGVELSF